MENNELLERLLQDDKENQVSVKEGMDKKDSRNIWEVQISKIRIVTAKYKVYIVLLLIFICLLLLIYIPDEKNFFKSNKNSFNQVNSQLNELKRDIKLAEDDMKYLCDNVDGIINNEENIKNCLANSNVCSDLPESWKTWSEDNVSYDLSIPLSYLQVNSLYNKKMPVDEKKVLKNLNEYLIKQDISGTQKGKVWNILRINIWDPKFVDGKAGNFWEAPVDVEIEFDTVDDLISFLYNIEKKMINNKEDRILYKIQSVSYDVISRDEPQVTDISMIAYYYYNEKFVNSVECSDGINSLNTDQQDTQDEDTSNSDWFLQSIFKNFRK